MTWWSKLSRPSFLHQFHDMHLLASYALQVAAPFKRSVASTLSTGSCLFNIVTSATWTATVIRRPATRYAGSSSMMHHLHRSAAHSLTLVTVFYYSFLLPDCHYIVAGRSRSFCSDHASRNSKTNDQYRKGQRLAYSECQ